MYIKTVKSIDGRAVTVWFKYEGELTGLYIVDGEWQYFIDYRGKGICDYDYYADLLDHWAVVKHIPDPSARCDEFGCVDSIAGHPRAFHDDDRDDDELSIEELYYYLDEFNESIGVVNGLIAVKQAEHERKATET